MARQYSAPLLGGIGLVSTLLSLLIASLLPGGLRIEGGAGIWILAALVIWFITAVGGWILLALLAKRAKRKQAAEDEEKMLDKLAKRTDKGGGTSTGKGTGEGT